MQRIWKKRAIEISLAATVLCMVATEVRTQERPPQTVTVETVRTTSFTATVKLPGRIKASTEAEVRPQVSGIIQKRLFEEGAYVTEGQELYKIADENYVSAVVGAKATLAEAQATYDLAVIDERRAGDLFNTKSGTAANRDTAAAQRGKSDAALQRARADLTTAEIDLARTTIRAPISGVIGLSQNTQGALVAAQQTAALATIRTLDPVFVDVTQSATDLMRWMRTGEAEGFKKINTASMILPDGTSYEHKGELKAAEPKVEPTTGMVTLRISYQNPNKILLPGLYVEVELPQKRIENAVLVSQGAVMRNPAGDAFVWLVSSGKVEQRGVKIFSSQGSRWVTTDGLKDNDQVITSGFQKIKPGDLVQIAAPQSQSDTGKASN